MTVSELHSVWYCYSGLSGLRHTASLYSVPSRSTGPLGRCVGEGSVLFLRSGPWWICASGTVDCLSLRCFYNIFYVQGLSIPGNDKLDENFPF